MTCRPGRIPSHVSTLKVTDPELIEVFDNFAFDEVLAYSSLGGRGRAALPAVPVR